MKISILRQVIRDAWRAVKLGYLSSRRDRYGYIHPTATILQPCNCSNKKSMYIYEHANIGENAEIICRSGKFILKKYSTIAPRLTAIGQNHDFFKIGTYPGSKAWMTNPIIKDIIIEDYVWIGANVTLCPGAHIGRGCMVAAGAVCTGKFYPPYTIIGGNPAKIIKYRFTLEEQLKHEELIVPKEERLDPVYLKELYDNTQSEILKRHS